MVSVPIRQGLQKRVYARINGGEWMRHTPDELTTVQVVDVIPVIGGIPPPVINTFPNADPAVPKSRNDKFVVKSDGSGSWGPLTFNADGAP